MLTNENIDKLISSLNELKYEKQNKEQKMKKTIEEFSTSYSQFKNTSEEMFTILSNLKCQIKKVEDDRTNLINQFEKQTYSTKQIQSRTDSFNSLEDFGENKIKKFEFKDSFLSNLFKKQDYETIYNIFLSFLIFLIAIFITGGYLNQNHLMKFDQLEKLFTGFSFLIRSLVSNFILASFCVFVLNLLIKIKISRSLITFGYISYIIFYFYHCSHHVNGSAQNMAVLCRLIYYSEIVRTILKLSAYFLEKVWMVTYAIFKGDVILKSPSNEESSSILIVKDRGNLKSNLKERKFSTIQDQAKKDLSCLDGYDSISLEFQQISYKSIVFQILNFLYFYLCPTLIYRDSYPKLKLVKIKNVLLNLANAIMGFLFNYFIVDMMLIPFINGNLNYLKPENILSTLINFVIFSFLILFVSFFGVCHSYFNLFADILGFADRNFYGDFWNAKTPKEFVSKIIMIFNEFFEYYLAFMMRKYLKIGGALIEIINFFLVSALVEFIFYYSMGYFVPVITILMIMTRVFSTIFDLLKITRHSISNFFTWMFVTLGCGILVFVSLTAYYIKNDINLDHGEICSYKFYSYFKGFCGIH